MTQTDPLVKPMNLARARPVTPPNQIPRPPKGSLGRPVLGAIGAAAVGAGPAPRLLRAAPGTARSGIVLLSARLSKAPLADRLQALVQGASPSLAFQVIRPRDFRRNTPRTSDADLQTIPTGLAGTQLPIFSRTAGVTGWVTRNRLPPPRPGIRCRLLLASASGTTRSSKPI